MSHFWSKSFVIAIGMASIALCQAASAATIYYYDDFSGSNGTDLNGTAPDTRPSTETWLGGTGAEAWQADGSVTPGAVAQGTAWLPFVPSPGQVYELSLAMSVGANVNGDWFALGFAGNGGVSTDFISADPFAWGLKRGTSGGDANEVYSVPDPSTTGIALEGVYAGTTLMSIVLDTNPALWTAEWFVDGLSVRGPEAFAVNPAITHVGFGRYTENVGGSVDNFQLTVVPEPASIYAMVMGLFALAFANSRSRARKLAWQRK